MKLVSTLCLAVALAGSSLAASAQDAKPYKEGNVIETSYIRIKPGKFDEYMAWLAGPWKQMMEARKKAGLINGYEILAANPRSPNEPDLVLVTSYPNMAALDKGDENEALMAKQMGGMAQMNKGYADRGSMREVLGGELLRELVLK